MKTVDSNLESRLANLKPGDAVPVPPEPRNENEIKESWCGNPDEPLVSIVCHTYNHERFIKKALDGFLMQRTDFPFEIIVHDDASIDGTADILKAYQSRYPSIIRLILQTENQFSQGVRPPNFTFPMAKGKYIALCEGDDYWIDQKKISRQTEFLEANLDYVLTYTDSISFTEGQFWGKDFGGARRDLTREELQKSPSIFTLTVVFRNVLDVPAEANCVFYGDLFMWTRLGSHGKGKYMSDVLPSFYRVHEGGINSLVPIDQQYARRIQTFAAISSYYRRVGNKELEKFFLREVRNISFFRMGISLKLMPLLRGLSVGFKAVFGVFGFLRKKS